MNRAHKNLGTRWALASGLGFGDYIGIMEKKMETTTMGLGFRVWGLGFRIL